MIALPVWQPWATLLAIGAKRVETRDWAPRLNMVGERIAIYATVGGLGVRDLAAQLEEPYFAEALRGLELPRGAIVGTAILRRGSEMTAETIEALRTAQPDEHAFGWYAPGRWAWVFSDAVAFDEPIETRPPKAARGPFRWTA